jgi:hypothetical protein
MGPKIPLKVEIGLAKPTKSLFAGIGQLHLMAAHLEYVGEALRVIAVVFDDQDTNGHAASLPFPA